MLLTSLAIPADGMLSWAWNEKEKVRLAPAQDDTYKARRVNKRPVMSYQGDRL